MVWALPQYHTVLECERVSVGEGASEWLTAIERVIYFTL